MNKLSKRVNDFWLAHPILVLVLSAAFAVACIYGMLSTLARMFEGGY
jgi:hypothetical protein